MNILLITGMILVLSAEPLSVVAIGILMMSIAVLNPRFENE